MGLKKLLEARRTSILNQWIDVVIGSYPPDSAIFFKSQGDGFLNPVGETTRTSLKKLFDSIINQNETDSWKASLEPLMKIRAVQNFTASQAVGFLFSLKTIIRKELKKDSQDLDSTDLVSMENRIDSMVLAGFDIYMQCREKIYDLKTNEERSKIYKAFARAGLIKDIAADEPELKFV